MRSAPDDTVLFDADNVPGGEPSADAYEVDARCIDARKARFTAGLVAGAGTIALGGLATVMAVRGQTATTSTTPPRTAAATR